MPHCGALKLALLIVNELVPVLRAYTQLRPAWFMMATARAVMFWNDPPVTTPEKKSGCCFWTMTSTAAVLPALGPVSGGLWTVTVVLPPFAKPLVWASFCAADWIVVKLEP